MKSRNTPLLLSCGWNSGMLCKSTPRKQGTGFMRNQAKKVMDSLGPILLYHEDKAELSIEAKTSHPLIDFGDKLVIPWTIHTTKALDEFGFGQSFW